MALTTRVLAGGSDGQNQERSQTQHTTHAQTCYTRVHVTISGEHPLQWTTPNRSRKHRWQQGACAHLGLQSSTPVSEAGHFEVSFFKTAETDKNNKKISLHRFKPVIFSKMIQNCQNQVEDGGYSRLIRGRGRHRGREDRKALHRESVVSSVSHSRGRLPSPGTMSTWASVEPGGGSAWSLSGLVCLVPPRALLGGWPGERLVS